MAADAVAEAGDILDKLKIDEKKEETMSDSKGDASSQKKGKSAGRRFFRSFRLVRRPYEERLKEFEEEQKKKEVLETNCRGTVKWYSVRGKYGFISREDGKGDDVFCHQSGISMSQTEKFYLRSLAPDQVVEFDLVKGSKGIEAANIRGPDGTAVQDAKDGRSFFRFPFFRRDKKSSGKKDGDSKSKDDEKSDNREVDKSASKKTGGLRSKFNRRNKEKKTDGEEPPKEEPTSSDKTEDVTELVQNDAEANKQ